MAGVNHLDFDGYQSRIDCGSDSGLDNLPQGANGFTAELWINIRAWSEFFDDLHLLSKIAIGGGNWSFRVIKDNDYSLSGFIQDNDGNTALRVNKADFNDLDDFEFWNHLALTFNFYGDKKMHVWINGAEATYYLQETMTGTPNTDAAAEFYIGSIYNDRGPYAYLGWCRVSKTARYTTGFTPPPRCALPAIDADTIGQWIGTEPKGAVTIVDNQEGTAARDGTPNLLTRIRDCPNPGTFLRGVRVGL